MTSEIWKPTPDPSVRVCRDCMIPAGGWPAVSCCWDPSWRGWPAQPIQDCGIDVNSDSTNPTPCHRGSAPRHDKLYSRHSWSRAWPCCKGLPGHSPKGAVWQQILSFPLEMSGTYLPTITLCSFANQCVCHDVFIPACSIKTLVKVHKFYRLHHRQLFYSRGLTTRREISHQF